MSDSSDENVSKIGQSITYETIAGGRIRPKVKIWFDHIDPMLGAIKSAELYKNVLEQMRKQGFIIDGDPK